MSFQILVLSDSAQRIRLFSELLKGHRVCGHLLRYGAQPEPSLPDLIIISVSPAFSRQAFEMVQRIHHANGNDITPIIIAEPAMAQAAEPSHLGLYRAFLHSAMSGEGMAL